MFGKYLNKFLGSSLGKVVGIIGGIGGVKYGYDSFNDYYSEKILKKNEEELIENIILTDKDKEAFKMLGEQRGDFKDLTEREMKEIKYEYIKKRKEQLIQDKILKVNKKFEGDFDHQTINDKIRKKD